MRGSLVLVCSFVLAMGVAHAQQTRLENMQNKVILLFTPHPDDDVFGAGGTIALLNRNHNKVYIVVYTNDDKGSYDPDMSSQRLAQIRKAEQEVSEGLLGTPKENIQWMGYDDGMLEQGLKPYTVPEMYFFYPSPQEANYFVNIDGVAELKFDAAAKQVSQFEPAVIKYRPDWTPEDLKKAKDEMRHEQPKKDGHYVEAFRYATGFNQY